MPWRALSVEVDADAADALGDALLDAGALSATTLDPQSERCLLCALFPLGADGAAALRAACATLGLPDAPFSIDIVEDDDWVRRTQAQFQPIVCGERLWVAPGWHEPPPGWGGAVVRIDPGMAFGTGSHPSTRLMLEYLADGMRGGERVLDYGCGSGILAVAAARLGASEVDGVDIDPQSLLTATENAARNGVTMRASIPEQLGPGVYDVVLANILAQPLILLAPLLVSRVAAGGRIALSGILETQAEEVAGAYRALLGEARTARTSEGWALVEGRRA